MDLKINSDIIEATALPHYPIKPGYTNPDPSRKKHPYKLRDKAYLMEQVHIYSKAELPENSIRVSLQKDDVAKLSSYKPTKTATIINHTASVLLVSAAIFAIGVGISAASEYITMVKGSRHTETRTLWRLNPVSFATFYHISTRIMLYRFFTNYSS